MATLTLHKGDCLAIMKDISANSIDLIICDLPYGVLTNQNINKNLMRMENGIATGKKAQTPNGLLQGCKWDVKIDLAKFWTEAKRILKNEHCPVIHFCTTRFGNELINSNPSWFRYDLVWDKQRGVSFLSANKMPMRSHEMIYVFSKAGAYYNRVDVSGNPYSKSGVTESKVYNIKPQAKDPTKIITTRCVKSVVSVENASHSKDQHPTQKPVALYRWLIERYSPPDGTVLDPTFGSGNSVFTAWEMGRHAIGIEKDDGFYDKAEKKLNTIE